MTEAKNDFEQWCEANGEGPGVVDADLEGYPLPHNWDQADLIAKAADLSYDKTWCRTMFRLEAKGKCREAVLISLALAIYD